MHPRIATEFAELGESGMGHVREVPTDKEWVRVSSKADNKEREGYGFGAKPRITAPC